MPDSNLTRVAFIDRILTSSIAGEAAKRFFFADGEVAAVCTLSRKVPVSLAQPVVLVIVTFPPLLIPGGVHDFGIDYFEQPVASTDEAHAILAHFDQAQAVALRAKYRAARAKRLPVVYP